jgi:hypothetical protein
MNPINAIIIILLAIILAIFAQIAMPAEAKPVTEREALDSMTVAQFIPGTEEYQIWSITQ